MAPLLAVSQGGHPRVGGTTHHPRPEGTAFASLPAPAIRVEQPGQWLAAEGPMPGRLAIDFGTSNTVVALFDEKAGEGVPLGLPEVGEAGVVPSLIHYDTGGARWLGQQ